ncbi:Txe/YoeB family addiction module toxin [Rickettsia endosymbiont of Oedothorax gibbosus]|uniref:Txe/YoeB family addiction module toxin n=1 Tax=Rickettsia endosymbiont of Oedothorax gibbosus TaxID=931099 RepID=UPI0024E13708|nr:Txe/YoeB family addiction module toxin [Rickettsia endosymbiont of Oedothorax gibbosus]
MLQVYDAWNDYQYFQENDIRILEKINKIIRDISRSSFSGIGKPEPLKHSLSGFWHSNYLLSK